MYKIELYRINVSGANFTRVASIDDYKNLSFTSTMNGIGRASFGLNVFATAATEANTIPFRTQVIIKKDDSFVWAGYLKQKNISYGASGGTVTFECEEYLGHLKYRYTDQIKYYVQEDAGDMAWDLINTVQSRTNGFLGISKGSVATTTDRDRTYENKCVYDAITGLTRVVGGFDFDTTILSDSDNLFTGINFNVYTDLSTTREYPIFRVGDNVNQVRYMLDGEVYNDLVLYGAGFGENIARTTKADTPSQIGYTRMEAIVTANDVSRQDTLEEEATQWLNDRLAPSYKIQTVMIPGTVPHLGSVGLGDWINLDLVVDNDGEKTKQSIVNLTGTARIMGRSVRVDRNGAEYVTYNLKQ